MPSQSGSDDDGSLVHVPAVGINDLPPEPSLGRPQFVNGKLLVRGQNLVIPPLPTRSPLRPPPTPSRVPSDSALRDATAKALSGSPAATPATPSSFSKRKHALLELLSSERAFASDLALIRDIHIPLALGQSAGFTLPGIATPPASSSSSTRTVSTGSDTPAAPPAAQGPPMTREDVKTIFGNIEDIAQFADFFSEKLETALGDLIEGGSGQDVVGALFLEVIPVMTPHYTTYITRHPSALAHFQALSANPSSAFSAYLTQTRALVASHTHAWDIPSLLIKPVQRLLKYPLLLSSIIDDTSDLHPDKESLQIARQNMEEAARGVNEGRRRWEVVKGVLDGKAPSLNAVGRMRSFRIGGGGKVKGAEDDDSIDIAAVEEMEKRLKEFEKVMKAFGKEALIWIRSVKTTITSLREWSQRFGLVLGVGVDSSSDALNAFNEVLDDRLLSLCNDLESTLHAALIPQLKKLAATIGPPMLLISTMHNLRPSHIAFLNMPLAKSKNAATLMQASMSYQAIHAQLRHELPVYLRLLDKGFGAAILQFAAWQQKFWEETYARWSELWVALEINSMDSSGEETVRVWWSRFEEAEVELMQLGILSRRIYKNHAYSKSSSSSVVLVSPVSQTHSINSPRRPSFNSSHPSLVPIPHSRSQSLTTSEPATQSPSRARSKERPATMESRPKQVRHREDFQDWTMERGPPPAEYMPQEYHTHYPHPPPMPRMKSEPAHLRTTEPRKRNPQLRDSGYQESRNSIVSTRTSNSTNRDSANLATNVALQLGALSPSMSRFSPNTGSGGTSRARKNVKERTRLTDDSSQRGLSRSADVLQQEVVLVPNQPNQRRKNSQPQRFEDDIIHYSSTTSKTMRGSDNHQRVLRGSDETVGGGSVRSPTKRSQTTGPKHVRAESERRRRTQDDPPPYRSRALTAETYYRPSGEPAELVRRRAEPTELNTLSRTKRGDSLPAIGSNNRYSGHSGLPILFRCVVVQSFEAPPPHIKYQSFPFLTLRIDDVVQIVYDGGHPADHEHLPIEVDETEAETLFLIKDDQQQIGWGLASYMVPIA